MNQCIICRRLRGSIVSQKMADLPVERISPSSPFQTVGIDVFGHWNIISRSTTSTRRVTATAKRWAVIFVCLYSRAVHVEILDSMNTYAFINALRRFIALRGPVSILRSDQGSNFIGAKNQLNKSSPPESINEEQVKVSDLVLEGLFFKIYGSHGFRSLVILKPVELESTTKTHRNSL